jgi:hypothetical protein
MELTMLRVRFMDGKAIRIGQVHQHNTKDGTLIVGRWESSTSVYEYFAMSDKEVTVKCSNYGNAFERGTAYGHCPHDAEQFIPYHGLLCGFCALIETDPTELAALEEEAKAEAEWARMVPWG